MFTGRFRSHISTRIIILGMIVCFGSSMVVTPNSMSQNMLQVIPAPGTMISPTPSYTPPIIHGLGIDPQNPLKFDFLIDAGDENLQGEEFRQEADKLIKYFFAALTTPETQMWVNLSPDEPDRIIPDSFGRTEMGRDLLAQDYLLKQLSASLTHPDTDLGKVFWEKIVEGSRVKGLGVSDLIGKIWIMPDEAAVYVNEPNVFVTKSHLKVMVEEDYVKGLGSGVQGLGKENASDQRLATIRETIIPIIEKEVNEGKTFTNLRQIYNSMILAVWYKQNLQKSLLSKIYVDQGKTRGVDYSDEGANQKIYQQYVKALHQGVYDFIREDYDPQTQEIIPRKYFSGGVDAAALGKEIQEGPAGTAMLRLASRELRSTQAVLQPSSDNNNAELFSSFLDLSEPTVANNGKSNSDTGSVIVDDLALDKEVLTRIGVESATVLGQGAFARVYLGKMMIQEKVKNVTVKIYQPKYDQERKAVINLQVRQEVAALSALGRIIKSGKNYIVMPYPHQSSESLDAWLNKRKKRRITLSSTEAINLALQVLEEAQLLHNAGFVHHDIKPGNIIRTDKGKLELIDFGVAHHISTETSEDDQGRRGTMPYWPKEVWEGKLGLPASDVYTIGMLLYEWLTGEDIYRGTLKRITALELKKFATEEKFVPRQFNIPDSRIPERLKPILKDMLDKDYLARPSAEDAIKQINTVKRLMIQDFIKNRESLQFASIGADNSALGEDAAMVEVIEFASILHPNDIAAGLTPESTIGERDALFYNPEVNGNGKSLSVANGKADLPVTPANIHPIVYDAVVVLNSIKGIKTLASGPDSIVGYENDVSENTLRVARDAIKAMDLPMSEGEGFENVPWGKRLRIRLNDDVKLKDAKKYLDIFAKEFKKQMEDPINLELVFDRPATPLPELSNDGKVSLAGIVRRFLEFVRFPSVVSSANQDVAMAGKRSIEDALEQSMSAFHIPESGRDKIQQFLEMRNRAAENMRTQELGVRLYKLAHTYYFTTQYSDATVEQYANLFKVIRSLRPFNGDSRLRKSYFKYRQNIRRGPLYGFDKYFYYHLGVLAEEEAYAEDALRQALEVLEPYFKQYTIRFAPAIEPVESTEAYERKVDMMSQKIQPYLAGSVGSDEARNRLRQYLRPYPPSEVSPIFVDRLGVLGDAVMEFIIIHIYSKSEKDKQKHLYLSQQQVLNVLANQDFQSSVMSYILNEPKSSNGKRHYYADLFEMMVAIVFLDNGGFEDIGFDVAEDFIVNIFNEFRQNTGYANETLDQYLSLTVIPKEDGMMKAEDVGGIDLNPARMNLTTEGDAFDFGIPEEFQYLETMPINGLLPVIINITPVQNLPFLLGLTDSDEPQETSSSSTNVNLVARYALKD